MWKIHPLKSAGRHAHTGIRHTAFKRYSTDGRHNVEKAKEKAQINNLSKFSDNQIHWYTILADSCLLYTSGVFCAKGGVEPQSENVWRQADTYNVPRMAFINKMDILGANFYGAVEQIKTRLGKNAICIQLPIGKEDDFKGIIDLFEMKAYIYNDDKGDDISIIDVPEEMQDEAELYRTELVEKICELDDDLMMAYLEGEEPSTEELKAALRKATCECTAVPVCCGTAYIAS